MNLQGAPTPPGPTSPDATETVNACPACGARGARFFLWGKSLYTPFWYAYWRCAVCGLVYVSPRPGVRSYEGNIEQGQNHGKVFLAKVPFDGPEFRRNIIRPARRLIPPLGAPDRRRWLDVGCAIGNLLTEVHAAGYEPHGLELNAGMAQWARENRPHLNVRQGLMHDLPPGETFDVISADNVLEHVHDPVTFLTQARDRLTDGGLLIVRVPNLYNFTHPWLALAGKLPRSYFIDPDAHPVNYSRSSLTGVMQRCGLRVERVMEHLMLSYPLKHILARRAKNWSDAGRERLAALYRGAFLFDRLIPRGGVDITVFARREDEKS